MKTQRAIQLFTTGDIIRMTGQNEKTFFHWKRYRFKTKPLAGGTGTGRHCQWSVMQAVGLVVASEVKSTRQSCSPQFAGEVVDAFSSVTEEWLEKEIKKRGGYFGNVYRGRPVLWDASSISEVSNPSEIWPDVAAIYKRVTGVDIK